MPTTENAADGLLSLTALSNSTSQAMALERVEARNNKDWSKADELRDAIAELGYTVQDTPQGPVLIPVKDI
ncbi:MAG: hypothetical protein RRA15_02370 [bacterium]|nr:hypothetical protein [bacterium]MDT8365321.1 hypothetical protein [bacterium]